MRIERERDFARKLCAEFKIPFPQAYVASNRLEAEKILAQHPQPFVIKNPLCSPTSPVHTILCETVEDTRAWLRQVNYAEGVFLQEYLGRAEAGHIALVSGGEIHSLVTNQEYKYAFNGNLGIVAGAPLGGLVERDPDDKYGLARELIHPLRPWLREVKFNGPLQVTAVKRGGKWHVIEYNIRIGVTSGPMILRMLKNPVETVLRTARNKKLNPQFNDSLELRLLADAGGLRLSVHAGARAAVAARSGRQIRLRCVVERSRARRRRPADGHRPAHCRCDRAGADAGSRDCQGLREHPQDPRRGQLLSHGRRPKPVAAGSGRSLIVESLIGSRPENTTVSVQRAQCHRHEERALRRLAEQQLAYPCCQDTAGSAVQRFNDLTL